MRNSNKTASYNLRFIVAALLLLIAISAFGGGFYGILGAKGIPVKWLDGSPFSSYFVPALVLVIFVGGPGLIAGVLLLKGHAFGRYAALASAIILLVWIAVQVFIIGYVSWLQPAVAVISLLIIALTLFLFVYEQ